MYWKNTGTGEYKFQAQLGPGQQTGFQTYPGHQFIWSEVRTSWRFAAASRVQCSARDRGRTHADTEHLGR